MLLLVILAACWGPPAGLLDECTTSDDCSGDFTCLPWSGAYNDPGDSPDTASDAATMVCSLPCTTSADCPTVSTLQCGDDTVCSAGTCGYALCY